MKTVSIIGSIVVTFALLCYSIGFFSEQRRKQVTSRVLLFFTLGVLFDIGATTLMIIGSSNGMLTVHGFIGYSSLLLMLADTFLLWRHNQKQGQTEVSRRLHLYSRIAYSWWVIAYITGGVLVAIRKIHG
jgi:uncharacterized repeat protein (TIGR03987 family)